MSSFKEEAKQLTVTMVDPMRNGLPAEASAMVSALCSRSKEGPQANLAMVQEKGADKFMEQFYVGYGHASIGYCGSTKIFLSGLSMLAINDLQNTDPIYAGQESSTRYIDYSAENVIIPSHLDNDETRGLMDELFKVYSDSMPKVIAWLRENNVKPEGVSDLKWENTLKPRAFDILRSLLPAGCTTVGVWDTNLANVQNVCNELAASSREETCVMAGHIIAAAKKEYPSSFRDVTTDELEWNIGLEKARMLSMPNYYHKHEVNEVHVEWDAMDWDELRNQLEWLPERPKYRRLPNYLGTCGRVNTHCCIDFGGFRDLNRHKKGNARRSWLTPMLGFNKWYLDQMPTDVFEAVEAVLVKVNNVWQKYKASGFPEQDLEYIMPMGYLVRSEFSYPIDNAVYVAELRSGLTVHPTVRRIAIEMGNAIEAKLPIRMYHNRDISDALDVRRADQTITKK